VKILQVCPYDLRRPGGVQRHVLDLAAALRREGHDVRLLAPGAPALPFAVGQRMLHALGTSFEAGWVPRDARTALARYLASERFDVAHLHAPWSPFLPLQVLRALEGTGTARVATFHDLPPPTTAGSALRALYRPLSRWLSGRLEAAIAVSPAPAGHLRLAAGCPLYVMPACIELAELRKIGIARAGGGGARLLCIGRLEPRKGVDVLLRAFARLRAARPDASLTLLGDGDERAALEALARSLRIADAVVFLGAADEAEKRSQLAQADVLCAPARHGESFGLVLVEAMAAGVPVVSADNAGYRTVLTGAGAAGLAPAGDAAALADRLAAVLGDDALRARLSGWGRDAAAVADLRARLPEFLAIYASARSKRERAGK